MHRLVWITSFLLITSACSISTSPRRAGYGANGQGDMGNPREVLQAVDGHLRERGYAAIGPAVHNGKMPPNGVVAYAIDARPGECIVALALGEGGSDVNMVLIDPYGRTVGYNVSPDPHPWVAHCPAQGGRFTARVQLRGRGTGYYYAAYMAPSGARPELAQFFGGQSQVQTAEIDEATSRNLAALDEHLANEGYRRQEEPRGVVLEQGQDRNFPLNLEGGRCYAFASLAGPGVRDTDVSVVDGAGNVLARGSDSGQDGVARFCAPTTGSYTLRTHPYQGSGPVFVAGYFKTTEQGNAPPTPDPSQPLIEARSEAGAGLEDNFRLLDADMQARGYEGYGEPSRGELGESQVRDFPIDLQGGKCYAILAVGDNAVRDMDLILLDPSGHALDRDIEQDARPVVRVCPDQSGRFTMRVQMMKGSGDFIYAPYRWPRGTHGPFGLSGIIYVRLAEITSLLDNEGYAPSPDFAPGKGKLARQGDTATQTFELQGDQCYTVVVVGGEGVNDLDVTLLDGRTEVASDGTRNAFPSVRFCPTHAGRYKARIVAGNGAGEYFYQLFTRQ